MVANNKHSLKDRLREAMQERKMSFPKLSISTGIPKERMYKWYSEHTNPKAEDVEILEKWISGDLEKVPQETVPEEASKKEASTLERAILNMTEVHRADSRTIERLVALLEMKMGAGSKYMELAGPGEKGTIPIPRNKEKEKSSGPAKDRNK